MIPFRSCASGILLWLRILYEANLLAFANTASRMVTTFHSLMLSSAQILTWCHWQYNMMEHHSTQRFCQHFLDVWGCNHFVTSNHILLKSRKFLLEVCWQFLGKWRSSMWEQNYSASYVRQQSILALNRCHMTCDFSHSSPLYLIASCVMETSVFLFKCKNPNISCSVSENNHAWIHSIMQLFSESLQHQISQ